MLQEIVAVKVMLLRRGVVSSAPLSAEPTSMTGRPAYSFEQHSSR